MNDTTYVQLTHSLKQEIISGIYKNEGKLPEPDVLAAKCGVTEKILMQAMDVLEQEGFITRRHVIQTFINRPVKDKVSVLIVEDDPQLSLKLKEIISLESLWGSVLADMLKKCAVKGLVCRYEAHVCCDAPIRCVDAVKRYKVNAAYGQKLRIRDVIIADDDELVRGEIRCWNCAVVNLGYGRVERAERFHNLVIINIDVFKDICNIR